MKNKHCKLELVNKSLLRKRTALKEKSLKSQRSNFFISTKEIISKQNSLNKFGTKVNFDLDEQQYDVDKATDQEEDREVSKSRVKFTPVSLKKFDEPQEKALQTSSSMAVNSLPIESGFSQLNILKLMNY